MQYRQLGSSGFNVSVVAMGCWAIAGDAVWGAQDEREAIAAIHHALELGINLFDTAEAYGDGNSEVILGKALQGRRDEAIIASKVSAEHLAPGELQAACERSLRRLGTDHIDLYQVHWPNPQIPIGETLQALEDLRRQGKVRAIGVCNFGPRDFADLLAAGGSASNQLPYSLLWRGIEYEVRSQCVESGTGILCYSPLAQGLLTGKFASAADVPDGRARTRHFSGRRPLARHGEPGCEAETFRAVERVRRISQRIGLPMAQVALAWVLHQPGVTTVLAGARRPQQIEENAQAAEVTLSPEVLAELDQATAELKRILGTNLDQYQSASRCR